MLLGAQPHLDRSDVQEGSPLLKSLQQADLRKAIARVDLSA